MQVCQYRYPAGTRAPRPRALPPRRAAGMPMPPPAGHRPSS